MVNRVWISGRDRTAIASSIAIHCCVLATLVFIPPTAFQPDAPDERALLPSVVRIEHRPPLPIVKPRRGAAPPVTIVRATAEPPIVHVAHTVAHASRAMVVTAERRFSLRASQVAVQPRSVSAPTLVAVDKTPVTSQATADPAAAAVASAAPSPVAVAQRESGIGNFEENYPAKLDPGSRGSLFSGVAVAFVIRVTIDESGHPIAIEFVRAPADPSLQAELRTRVLAARFIPQVCNGLNCAGTIELHN